MNSFQATYLKLLRQQVDEEISYLVSNGHDNGKIFVPCIFCAKMNHGYYICHRLKELRQFQSSIVQKQNHVDKPVMERKSIGVEKLSEIGYERLTLPLMFPEL